MEMQSNELYHHGRKGQRWGIRRGPPYPIDEKVIRCYIEVEDIFGKTIRTE